MLSPLYAAKYVLKDGRILEGRHNILSRVDEKGDEDDARAKPIVAIDDGLRYVYLSKSRLSQINDEQMIPLEVFKTGIRANYDGQIYKILGGYNNSTPFDRFGRRLLEIRDVGGVTYAEQAIIELTSHHLKISGLRTNNKASVWDMRLATNGVPRDQLTPILMNLIDPQDLEDRLKLVRFYYGGKQYENADKELDEILKDWNDDPDVKQRLMPLFLNVRQQRYQRLIDELELRFDNGQYQFVKKYLTALETDRDLPDRLLEPVRRLLRRYEEFEKTQSEIIAALKSLYEKLLVEEQNTPYLAEIPPILDEIAAELNMNTVKRLASFQLYANDQKLTNAEKLAIGITGWFAGVNADNSRLAVAAELPTTRKLIREYLQSGNNNLLRNEILTKLKQLESARPNLIAGILATMKPPQNELPESDPDKPGYYRLEVKTTYPAQIEYAVQLPPEYDPNRHYPMIVTLNGVTQSPEMQLDWWSGSWREGERIGQASRYGCIVIAPDWNPAKQTEYDFSAFSHAAVLLSVKDAFRRFNVDTDKVYLSGHGVGGSAAWDMALAHPDLWAGAVPFNAVAEKYIDIYRAAIRHIPLYLVWGEMEGIGKQSKWLNNAAVLNKYLTTQARPGDVTVVKYIGRGSEGFSDEILEIFDWMKSRQRNVTPLEFETETMRAWDSFFWWVEMPGLGKEKPEMTRDPMDFPDKNPTKGLVTVRSKLLKLTNNVQIDVKPRVAETVVFLTPEMIDFKQKTSVKVNDKRYQPLNGIVEPDIEVMLEDARTRSDRIHPFWVKLTGKT
ncbi:peptidase [Planctomycetales bacterium]|nr:peptidase [Planctomycetales bacterium]